LEESNGKRKTRRRCAGRSARSQAAIEWMKKEGDIIITDKEVDPNLEITGIQNGWTAVARSFQQR